MAADEASVRFIADDMLGKLAKWLRILGFDTAYSPVIPDDELSAMARAESRVLLTRDTKLLARWAGGPCLFIRHDAPSRQLSQVLRELHLDPRRRLFSRCLICNRPVVPVDREEVRGRVPQYTFDTQQAFSQCPQCRRIFWAGTHHQRATQWLAHLEEAHDQGP